MNPREIRELAYQLIYEALTAIDAVDVDAYTNLADVEQHCQDVEAVLRAIDSAVIIVP